MIPAEKMIALWDKQQITKLAVEHISHQPASTRVLPASAGSCTIGWLGENPIDKSDRSFFVPRSFPRVLRSPNCDARVREFSKVEGQSWAKELLRRSGELDEDDEGE